MAKRMDEVHSVHADEIEGVVSRILAAALAVGTALGSLLLALWAIGGRWRVATSLYSVPTSLYVVTACAFAVVGYVAGLRGLVDLYYHLIYRQSSDRSSLFITIGLWCALLIPGFAAFQFTK